MVYGRVVSHQLCQFHLLREYRRNIGKLGFGLAKELLNAESVTQARKLGRELTRGRASYWCEGDKAGISVSEKWIWRIQDNI